MDRYWVRQPSFLRRMDWLRKRDRLTENLRKASPKISKRSRSNCSPAPVSVKASRKSSMLGSPVPLDLFWQICNRKIMTLKPNPNTLVNLVGLPDYSGGSNTEHVRISNGQGCSVHGPDHSKTELQNGCFSLGRFIYKIWLGWVIAITMLRRCHSYVVPFEYRTLKGPVFRWIWY